MEQRPSVRRAGAAAVAAWVATGGLASCVPRALPDPTRPDEVVTTLVLLAGTVAALLLAAGCTALTAAGAAAAAGRSARRLHAVGVRLTPVVLRRALAVSLTAGVGLGLGTATATAGEADLGWRPTGQVVGSAPAPADPAAPAVPVAAPVEPVARPVTSTTTAPLDGAPGGAAGTTAPAPTSGPPPDGDPPATHVVRPGDTLWDVAATHLPADATEADVAAAWPRWWVANRDVVGPDPDLIHPGQVLHAPADDAARSTR